MSDEDRRTLGEISRDVDELKDTVRTQFDDLKKRLFGPPEAPTAGLVGRVAAVEQRQNSLARGLSWIWGAMATAGTAITSVLAGRWFGDN